MDKVTALVELKERINTVGFNQYRYIDIDDEGQKCFCSVGHLMDICGVDMTPALEDDDLNSYSVLNDKPRELIKPLIEEIGFTYDQLNKIQAMNDSDNKAGLNTYIDKLISGEGIECDD